MYALRKIVACELISHQHSTHSVRPIGSLLNIASNLNINWTTADINYAFQSLETYHHNIKTNHHCDICQCEVVEI